MVRANRDPAASGATAATQAAADQATAAPADDGEMLVVPSESLFEELRQWFRRQFPWWASSATLHFVGLCVLLLIGRTVVPAIVEDVPAFVDCKIEVPPESPPIVEAMILDQQFDPGKEIDVDVTRFVEPGEVVKTDAPPSELPPAGGGTRTDLGRDDGGNGEGFVPKDLGIGPKVHGDNRFAGGPFDGNSYGRNGGPGGFGYRHIPGGPGGGPPPGRSDAAIVFAMRWLANHQMPEGNWSLQDYHKQCKDASCTGAGVQESLSAATGMGLLPFLAAGQTHRAGKYQLTVTRGIYWLV